MGHYWRETFTRLDVIKTSAGQDIRGRSQLSRTFSLSFLTNGYLSSAGSHKQPIGIKNKIIAVSETRMNLPFHSICGIFSDASIFVSDLWKTANFTIWDYYQKSGCPSDVIQIQKWLSFLMMLERGQVDQSDCPQFLSFRIATLASSK